MVGRMKHRLVLGVVALVAVGAGGTALATGSSSGNAFLDDVAHRLGVTPATLQSAMNQAFVDRVNAMVKAGQLTQAQANAIEARMKANGGMPFFGLHGGEFGEHGYGGPGFFHHDGPFEATGTGPLEAAATYLGISPDTLRSDLQSGKTLAAVATSAHKSVSGLEQAMVAAVTKQLDAAVTAGRLSKTQESQIVSAVSTRIKDFVEHGFRFGRPGGDDDHGRPGSNGAPWGGSSGASQGGTFQVPSGRST